MASPPKFNLATADMASSKESHIERTAHEPRDPSLHVVIIRYIQEVNETVHIFRLGIPGGDTIKFLPGQWLDVYLPGIAKPGGFTITSPPSAASPREDGAPGYLELAVQKSPDNPAACWLWQEREPSHSGGFSILGATVKVRVGGSFVWPPPPAAIPVSALRKVVFVAGGVGVNPLVSMLSHLAAEGRASGLSTECEVHFFYSMKDPGGGRRNAHQMLFLERIWAVFAEGTVRGRLHLFLTRSKNQPSSTIAVSCNGANIPYELRRILLEDIELVVGEDTRSAVVYVCGVPTMTDFFVEKLVSPEGLGLAEQRVLFEKWW